METKPGNVLACTVEECSWWDNKMCRAQQIDVGDMHPSCDTYTKQPVQKTMQEMPPVRACMVTDCKYHGPEKICDAPGISVGYHSDHADCETYVPS